VGDLEDYLDTMRGLAGGGEVEIDPQRAGDLQAFRDVAAEQAARGVTIECDDD